MSDQTSVFDEQQEIPETPDTTQPDPFADQLKRILNENGEQKYKDVETALKALDTSQQFIRQLTEEKRQLEANFNQAKSDLEKMGTIDDYVKRLQPDRTAEAPKETPKGNEGLSVSDLDKLLEQRLNEREVNSVRTANLKQVEDQIAKTHGDGTVEFIKQRSMELSMSPTELKELAMKSPSAALALLGVETKKPTVPTQSSVIPPRQAPDDNPVPQWERSAVHGGMTNTELVNRWNQAKAFTHKRLNVESK